jgi:ParB family chromosome partitioning protein
MADMKKQDMAEAAEQLLAATGWLPDWAEMANPPRDSGEKPRKGHIETPTVLDSDE